MRVRQRKLRSGQVQQVRSWCGRYVKWAIGRRCRVDEGIRVPSVLVVRWHVSRIGQNQTRPPLLLSIMHNAQSQCG